MRVEHYGYLGVVRDAKEKSRRNLDLLLQQSEEGVDTAFHHYNLGSEYSGAGEQAKALEHLERAWAKLQDDPEILSYGFVPSAARAYVQSLRINGASRTPSPAATTCSQLLPGFTDIVLDQAHATRMPGRPRRAPPRWSTLPGDGRRPEPLLRHRGFRHVPGADRRSAIIRRAQGRLAEAERLLREVRAEHPQFLSGRRAAGRDHARARRGARGGRR